MLPGRKDVKQSETNIRPFTFDRDFCSPDPDAENIHGPADLVRGKDRFQVARRTSSKDLLSLRARRCKQSRICWRYVARRGDG